MKLSKTGQTRGAETDEVFQNRVSRNSTVLIRHSQFDRSAKPDDGPDGYENGFIVLVDPDWYFDHVDADALLEKNGLSIGDNALLFFERQSQWDAHGGQTSLPNGKPFVPATSRRTPLGGTYVARVHATTAYGDASITEGYAQSSVRGAGIRDYEYASSTTIAATKLQLEALVWLCVDALDVVIAAGMSPEGASQRSRGILAEAESAGLLDWDRLRQVRAIDDGHRTICPLCLELVEAVGFIQRSEQVEGRETWDNKITPINLFHIEELRPGSLLHRPYNLGWGHHHCNVVAGDKGIPFTLDWMKRVIENNGGTGAIDKEKESIEEAVER
nr:BstXI family restriction endonuclease [Mycolicibacterium malmesburyense]CRL70666.1 BstXI restriction endonuclease [Mycolicibacterium malmesburyense]